MFRIVLSMVVIAGTMSLKLSAQDVMPSAVLPYVDDQTVVVARIDLARIDLTAVFTQLNEFPGDEKSAAKQQKKAATVLADLRKAGVGTVYGVASLADIADNPVCLIVPLQAEADGPKIIAALKEIEFVNTLTFEVKGNTVLAGSPAGLARLTALKSTARADLVAALAANKNAAVQIAFAPSADLRRVAEETMPRLPKSAGGDSIQIISRGLAWVSISLSTTPNLDASIVAQTKDADTANHLKRIVATFFDNRVKELQNRKEEQDVIVTLGKIFVPMVEKDQLIVRVDEAKFAKVVPDLAKSARDASHRRQSSENLKQIAYAMHRYLDAHSGRFPTDVLDREGKAILSWRVNLLPYLEQKDLHQQFKLNEPWDSEHNKALLAKIPAVYVAPAQKSLAGTTTYLGPVGDAYLFRPKAKVGLKIQDITDGTSNTIMIVEAADSIAVEWTKPGDWTPDPKDLLTSLIGHTSSGFNAAFCDGSVRLIGKNVEANLLLKLLTTGGGEVIGEIP